MPKPREYGVLGSNPRPGNDLADPGVYYWSRGGRRNIPVYPGVSCLFTRSPEAPVLKTMLVASLLFQQQVTWSLQDQFGRTHTPKELQGRVVLLVTGDGGAEKSSTSWVRATLTALGRSVDTSRVTIVRVADLRQVPTVPRPFAKAQLPSLSSAPVLLDFSGVIARRYGYLPGGSNQLVIGADGRVLAHTRGSAVNPVQASILAARIRDAIEQAPKGR